MASVTSPESCNGSSVRLDEGIIWGSCCVEHHLLYIGDPLLLESNRGPLNTGHVSMLGPFDLTYSLVVYDSSWLPAELYVNFMVSTQHDTIYKLVLGSGLNLFLKT